MISGHHLRILFIHVNLVYKIDADAMKKNKINFLESSCFGSASKMRGFRNLVKNSNKLPKIG